MAVLGAGENIRTMDGALVLWQKTMKCSRRLFKTKLCWLTAVVLVVLSTILLIFTPSVHAVTNNADRSPPLSADLEKVLNKTHQLLNDPPVDHRPLRNHWQGQFSLRKAFIDELKWNYLLEEKEAPYVGDKRWLDKLDKASTAYVNALAVFPNATVDREHGLLGVTPAGHALWRADKPLPPDYESLSEDAKAAVLKSRGFYEELSDALPLDRAVVDTREEICRSAKYDITKMPDASVVITFVNEPLSTLLRTLHSVLNNTPSPILREIILVDDHSDFVDDLPGGPLYEYIKYLPKVKLMRLSERRGIVQARLAGARSAKGDVLVVLDSHIEVNKAWLEPQLQRILESPKSVVFPKILGISPTSFEYKANSGIGCHVSWRWSIVEQSSLTGAVDSVDAVPSSSMAGGLFAVDRQYFLELGGYDDGFIAWGAENVEMAFRVWMCGGRVECAPCSRTYHIYRKGSTGYQNPQGALWTNRMRTARVWMDDYFHLAARLIDISANRPNKAVASRSKLRASPAGVYSYNGATYGDVGTMLRLKENLKCKSFQWFLENVDPQHDVQSLADVIVLGRIGAVKDGGVRRCLDLAGKRAPGDQVKTYSCQNPAQTPSSNQGFLVSKHDNRIRLMTNDKRCLSPSTKNEGLEISQCMDDAAHKWRIEIVSHRDTTDDNADKTISFRAKYNDLCLSLTDEGADLKMAPCNTPHSVLFGDAFTNR